MSSLVASSSPRHAWHLSSSTANIKKSASDCYVLTRAMVWLLQPCAGAHNTSRAPTSVETTPDRLFLPGLPSGVFLLTPMTFQATVTLPLGDHATPTDVTLSVTSLPITYGFASTVLYTRRVARIPAYHLTHCPACTVCQVHKLQGKTVSAILGADLIRGSDRAFLYVLASRVTTAAGFVTLQPYPSNILAYALDPQPYGFMAILVQVCIPVVARVRSTGLT